MYVKAQDALDRLNEGRPGDLLTGYYLAYTHYKLGRLEKAKLFFSRVISAYPQDAWSRFMLGKSFANLGQKKEALRIFRSLIRGSDVAVASESRTALKELSNLVSSDSRPRRVASSVGAKVPGNSKSAWRLLVAGELDTNPAYVADNAYTVMNESATALSFQARGELLLWRNESNRLYFAPQTFLRAYPSGPSEYDLAGVGADVELIHHKKFYNLWVGVSAQVQSLGWELFLDIQELYAGTLWRQAGWTATEFVAAAFRRGSHIEAYNNLQALGARGQLVQRIHLHRSFRFEFGYGVAGESAATYSANWTGTTEDPETVPFDATLSAKASFVGHGPVVGLRIVLPWRKLRLDAFGWMQWRSYPYEESVVYNLDGQWQTWSGNRNDRIAVLSASMTGHVIGSFQATVRYHGVINNSSLDGIDKLVDRRFSRHILSLGIEARF